MDHGEVDRLRQDLRRLISRLDKHTTDERRIRTSLRLASASASLRDSLRMLTSALAAETSACCQRGGCAVHDE
jgi:hypothetical protein